MTGNFQAAAWAKINAAGLQSYFQGGAFGNEREHRTDILSLAMDRFGIFGANVLHIGDAIADVQAAKDFGAGGVGGCSYGRFQNIRFGRS